MKGKQKAARRRSGDRTIEHRAHALLGGHHYFHCRADRLELECRQGKLVVRGSLPTYYLKQVLQHALMSIDGVERVENHVTVELERSSD